MSGYIDATLKSNATGTNKVGQTGFNSQYIGGEGVVFAGPSDTGGGMVLPLAVVAALIFFLKRGK